MGEQSQYCTTNSSTPHGLGGDTGEMKLNTSKCSELLDGLFLYVCLSSNAHILRGQKFADTDFHADMPFVQGSYTNSLLTIIQRRETNSQ